MIVVESAAVGPEHRRARARQRGGRAGRGRRQRHDRRVGGAADLAEAIVRVHLGGEQLRSSTRAWFERNSQRLSLTGSLERVLESYGVLDRGT